MINNTGFKKLSFYIGYTTMPKKQRLERKLYVMDNSDKKGWSERWTPDRDPLNIPHMRCILSGRPNVGKSNTVRNLILRADPPYTRLIIIHCDKHTTEWDDMSPTLITDKVPAPTSPIWGGTDIKTLCVLDDVSFRGMSKKQKSNLIMLFRNVSSHRNTNIALTCHNFFSVSIELRRSANFFVIWKSRDTRNIKALASRVGYPPNEFLELMNTYCRDHYDSIWVDCTPRSPYALRRNGYQLIDE